MLKIVYNLINNEFFCFGKNNARGIPFIYVHGNIIFMHEISYFDAWKFDIHVLIFPVSIS